MPAATLATLIPVMLPAMLALCIAPFATLIVTLPLILPLSKTVSRYCFSVILLFSIDVGTLASTRAFVK